MAKKNDGGATDIGAMVRAQFSAQAQGERETPSVTQQEGDVKLRVAEAVCAALAGYYGCEDPGKLVRGAWAVAEEFVERAKKERKA